MSESPTGPLARVLAAHTNLRAAKRMIEVADSIYGGHAWIDEIRQPLADAMAILASEALDLSADEARANLAARGQK